ncbi:MAG TPA: AarF/UbiB family protein [Acidimicrobiales bacterium]|nr:AarF/UbiB family protein [Acidimicrobiales bacterium]
MAEAIDTDAAKRTHPTGLVAAHGPYAPAGPPADALSVNPPPIDTFGWHEVRRAVLIVTTLILSVLKGVAVELRVIGRAGRRRWVAAAAVGLVDGFEHLGPTFVKLGQMIASSPSVFPSVLADACLRCLDEVRPFDPDEVRRRIQEDLGAPPESLFTSFDPKPLSAASIAQVHACVLPDGRQAVIKVQRPAIAARMNTDIRIMYRLARTLGRHPKARQANLEAVVVDLHQVTNEELNFALEAFRQDRFRKSIGVFGDNRYITAPEVFWDFCGDHLICMERMYGTPMDDFDGLRARGIDGELVLRRGLKVWMEAAMVHGAFHGDVHAGNLWVLEDGRAAFLDFGIMGELDETWRRLFRDMQYTAMIDGDYSRIVRNWKSVGVMPEDIGSDEDVGMVVKAAMEPLLDKPIGEVSLGELMSTNLRLAEQFGAKTPRELVLLSKQLLYFERYGRELAPDYNMSRDLFLIRNVFPDEVAPVTAERGLELPD